MEETEETVSPSPRNGLLMRRRAVSVCLPTMQKDNPIDARPHTPGSGFSRPTTPGEKEQTRLAEDSFARSDSFQSAGKALTGAAPRGGKLLWARVRQNSLPSLKLSNPTSEEEKKAARERSKSACDKLSQASEEQDATLLLVALAEAKAAHVDQKHITDATQLLQQLQARKSLDRALQGSDKDALKRAVAIARQKGLEGASLRQAADKMEQMEAAESLLCAVNHPETGALRLAIRRAQLASMDTEGELFVRAQKSLEELEALSALQSALRTKDSSKLQDAIEKASGVGIGESTDVMRRASERLAELDAPKRSNSKKTAQLSRKDLEIQDLLVRAISMEETGGLRDAIRHASVYGVEVPEVETAKYCLSRLEAMRHLHQALTGKHQDRDKISKALLEAEGLGLEGGETAQARYLLQQFEARDFLSTAITSKDVNTLPDAIKRAREMGLERQKIVKAEEILTKQLTKPFEERRLASTGVSQTPGEPGISPHGPQARRMSRRASTGALPALGASTGASQTPGEPGISPHGPQARRMSRRASTGALTAG